MTTACDLSVLVVTYRSRDTILACLRSVAAESRRLLLEVIIVDNASPDDTVAVTRDAVKALGLTEVTRLHPLSSNLGFAAANNFAAALARSATLLLLNPDAALSDRAAATLLQELARNPDAGVVGPRLTRRDGRWERSHGPMPGFFGELLQKLLGWLDRTDLSAWRRVVSRRSRRPRRPAWVSGACLAIPLGLWRQLGGMDEAMFLYYEDVDLCARARAAGRDIVYLPSAGVVHLGGASTRTRRGVAALAHRRSQVYFYRKHYGDHAARILSTALLVRFWLRAFRLGLSGRGEAADEAMTRFRAMREASPMRPHAAD